MANENQELQQQMEELRRSMQGLDASTKASTTGLNAFAKESLNQSKQIAKGAAGFGKTLNDGATDLKSFNTVIDIAAGAVGGLAKAIPYVGEAISAVAKGVGEASKYLVGELDKTAKSFNAVGQVGALTSKGMTGLYQQFGRAGLSMDQWQKQVVASSESLAQFRGLAGDGAEDFSNIVGSLTKETDNTLRNLGFSAEQIATGAAAFVKRETALGRAQSQTNAELAAGAKNYLKELDLLSRVTGQSKDALVKQQEAALSETRFLAVRQEMEEQGMGKQADALLQFQTVVSNLDKEVGQGIRDISSGIADTDAAQKLINSTNGQAANIVERLKSGAIDQAQAQKELGLSYKDNLKVMRDQGRYNKDAGEIYSGLAGSTKLAMLATDQNAKALKKGASDAKDLAEGNDDLTTQVVSAEKQLQQMAVHISELNIKALPAAATAVNSVTTSMNTLYNFINDNFGGGSGGKAKETKASATAKGISGSQGTSAGGGATFVGGAAGAGDGGSIMEAAEAGANEKPPSGGGGKGGPELAGISSKSGKSAQVGKEYAPAFQQLIDYLDGAGYKIDSLGGFADRDVRGKPGQKSIHALGGAIDINPSANPLGSELITDMPAEIGKVAASLGLGWGGNWKSRKDAMHFSAAKSEGGSMISAAEGGILSGPSSGYRPNLTMHGTEAIVPLDSPKAQAMGMGNNSSSDPGLMMAQLDKLDEMVSIMKNQLDINTKILQMNS